MRVRALLPAIVSGTNPRNSRRAPASSSCVPRSTMRPSRSTTIWSACCTVEIAVRNQDGRPSAHHSAQAGFRIRSSVSVSTLERESSRIRIRGSRITARAIAVRCFCPPESVMPRSPTIVSYCFGNSWISPSMLAMSAACRITRRFERVHAKRDIFAQRLAEQKSVLRHVSDRAPQRFERPFADRAPVDQTAFPSGASHSRAISAASVVFPLPVGPTIASVEPAGMCRLISCSTRSVAVRCGVPFAPLALAAGHGRRIGEIQIPKFDLAVDASCFSECSRRRSSICRLARSRM